jgi:putative alpha-1,2-mannosidase
METRNLSEANIYIQSAILNGEPLKRSFITHEEILNGSTLVFEMGNEPNKNLWSGPESAPYSMSRK